jgi:hypothetical protein
MNITPNSSCYWESRASCAQPGGARIDFAGQSEPGFGHDVHVAGEPSHAFSREIALMGRSEDELRRRHRAHERGLLL